jgi:predicted amidohydrolase
MAFDNLMMKSIRIGCVTQDVDIVSLKEIVRDNQIDLLVFPEHIQVLKLGSLSKGESAIVEFEMNWAKQIDCAMVMGMRDDKGVIFNVFVNPKANENETKSHLYIKHTMTDYSAFEWNNYAELSKRMFEPILFHEWRIGMTICYDSTFPIFSRLYGKQGIDLLVNSTGYDAKKDKWFRYHKVRSIENNCNSVVTMLWDEDSRNPPTYCFNREGGTIDPQKCIDDNILIYEIEYDRGAPEIDEYTKRQKESVNKNSDLKIPVGNVWKLIEKSDVVDKNVYCYHHKNRNVIFCVINDNEILKPEKVLQLLYNKKLDSVENKSFVVVNQHKHFSDTFFQTKLETVLKVRAMENYCVVIMESAGFSKCYQCTNYKTSQVVKPTNGFFGVDLRRAIGPKRTGLHNSEKWNSNIELLINKVSKM